MFTRYVNTNKSTPIYVIIQLCHIGTEKKELIEVNVSYIKLNEFDSMQLIIFYRMSSVLLLSI